MLAEGVDADVVLWDSHPLHLGAIPRQVWIDGIPQLHRVSPSPMPAPSESIVIGPTKPGSAFKEIPHVPTWDDERREAVEWEGLPPLGPKKLVKGKVVLKNVKDVWIRGEEGVKERWFAKDGKTSGTVVLVNGAIACVGDAGWCLTDAGELGGNKDTDQVEIDLAGGSVGPGLMTFGSPLGIEEIAGEASTGDGLLYDAFAGDIPSILNDVGGVVRAVDALQFGTRNAL